MARLTPRFSANRMVREYVERTYLPAAEAFRRRATDGARIARDLERWRAALAAHVGEVRILAVEVAPSEDGWRFEARIASGGLPAAYLRPEIYADPASPGGAPVTVALERGEPAGGAADAYVWRARVRSERPATDFTVRVVPFHPDARVPAEEGHVVWQR